MQSFIQLKNEIRHEVVYILYNSDTFVKMFLVNCHIIYGKF